MHMFILTIPNNSKGCLPGNQVENLFSQLILVHQKILKNLLDANNFGQTRVQN